MRRVYFGNRIWMVAVLLDSFTLMIYEMCHRDRLKGSSVCKHEFDGRRKKVVADQSHRPV